ncbi:MAG: peptide ABC transporter ATP-binding protein [Rhizobiales bacterium PAR1]|nr:MAG: peptide ABC transporter ATP-binding protein [Rhizobiales bacterium PAR1]
MSVILEAVDLHRHYPLPREGIFARRRHVSAVNGVSFALEEGKVLGIVGESGSGKSTLARLLVGLEAPEKGEVRFLGQRISGLGDAALRPVRHQIQMVFQDPFGSLDPRMRVLDSIGEPLDVAEPGLAPEARRERIIGMLERVGLGEGALTRYPHQFSGGQRQRIAIARALITHPKLLIADEPVSALDVSVQAQILNLLLDLKLEFGLSLVFISHDLGIVRYLSDRVIVMQNGKIVEEGETEALFSAPAEAYTRQLIAAMPKL